MDFDGTVDCVMDEARAVLKRLRRIEALEREGTDLAKQALERCRDALATPPEKI